MVVEFWIFDQIFYSAEAASIEDSGFIVLKCIDYRRYYSKQRRILYMNLLKINERELE